MHGRNEGEKMIDFIFGGENAIDFILGSILGLFIGVIITVGILGIMLSSKDDE